MIFILENLKVQELSNVEEISINGGCWGCDVIDAIASLAKAYLHS